MSNNDQSENGERHLGYGMRDEGNGRSPNCADQPGKGSNTACGEPKWPQVPKLAEPTRSEPGTDCRCPGPPATGCFDRLIAAQPVSNGEAERTKKLRADLEDAVNKAKGASADYTQERYRKQLEDWVRLDMDIAELVRTVECAARCWRRLLECYVCPLLYDIEWREQLLNGSTPLQPPAEVHSLYEQRYWLERDRDFKEQRFKRITEVLAAWEKPGTAIDKVLTDNRKLLVETGKLIASDAGKAVYDVFMRLVPAHLAIAPPDTVHKTAIKKEYMEFCKCGAVEADVCCGIDLGPFTLRRRLLGTPLPYLVVPAEMPNMLCCVLEKRWVPTRKAWDKAASDFDAVDARIKLVAKEIEDKFKSVEKDAKAVLPVDCNALERLSRDAAR